MKSLIIGAAGFVGAYLIRHLQQDLGQRTAATKLPKERISTDCNTGCMQGTQIRETEIYDLDILDADAVLNLLQRIRPDYVFHLAAQSSVAVAWSHPGVTVDVNIRGAVNVLEAVRAMEKENRPRVLLVGSGEEYGLVRAEEIPICEDNRLCPGNIYAATKACQTMFGSIYAKAYEMEVVMVRAFNHIGPNQEPLFVVADFCRQVAWMEAGRQEAVLRVGNLDVRRDFTDVRDVVRAYAMLAACGKSGEVYNVGSGRAVSIADIVRMILQKSGISITVEPDASKLRPVDLPVIEANIHKLQQATGWQPQIGLEQTIEETLHYWRNRALAGM